MKKPTPHCSTCNARSGNIFCHLQDGNLDNLDQHKFTKHFSRGEMLFEEGDHSVGLFCIRTGRIKIYKSGSEGKEIILGIARSGNVLGFRNVLTNEPYRRSAKVLEDAQVCMVEKEFFEKLIHSNPSMAFSILQHMGHELEETETKISELVNMNVRTRFVRLLLMLQRSYGINDAQGSLLNVRLTRQELGEMVGAATETIVRILSDLENEKFISTDGKKIRLLNTPALLIEASMEI